MVITQVNTVSFSHTHTHTNSFNKSTILRSLSTTCKLQIQSNDVHWKLDKNKCNEWKIYYLFLHKRIRCADERFLWTFCVCISSPLHLRSNVWQHEDFLYSIYAINYACDQTSNQDQRSGKKAVLGWRKKLIINLHDANRTCRMVRWHPL